MTPDELLEFQRLNSAVRARFAPLQLLGRGGQSAVYRVWDYARQRELALKCFPSPGVASLLQLKREYRAGSTVQHPNLVELFELFVSGTEQTGAFTMELVEGVDPRTWLWRELAPPARHPQAHETLPADVTEPFALPLGTAPGERPDRHRHDPTLDNAAINGLRALAAQLFDGLEALHGAGLVHGDIKPANVLVTADGRVVLLDFGISGDTHAHAAGTHLNLTPRYAAPEVRRGQPATPPSDIYSCGVLLFELATRTVPDSGARRSHHTRKAALRHAGLGADLAELIARCLDVRLERRPTAAMLRFAFSPDAERRRDDDAPDPDDRDELDNHAGSPERPANRRQLERLLHLLLRAQATRASWIALRSASGLGRTTLLRQLRLELEAAHRDVVLDVRTHHAAQHPYNTIDPLIDELIPLMRGAGPAARDLPALQPDSSLSSLFPTLQSLRRELETHDPTALPEPDGPRPTTRTDDDWPSYRPGSRSHRDRAVAELAETLERLATRHTITLLVDDAHHADSDSAYMLAQLARSVRTARVRVVLAFATQPETPPLLDTLRGLLAERIQEVELQPLDDHAARRLLSTMIGDLPDAEPLIRTIAEAAAGNPLILTSYGRWLRISQRTTTNWNLSFDQYIHDRFHELSPPLKHAIALLALAGQPLPRAVIAGAIGPPVDLALRHLRYFGVIVPYNDRADDVWAIAHERFARSVVAALTPAQHDQYLEQLAALAARHMHDDEAFLARLLARQGRRAEAVPLALRAIDRARRTLALQNALQLATWASNELEPDADQRDHLDATTAELLASTGQSAQAAELLLALARRRHGLDRLETRRVAAEMLAAAGDLDRAVRVLDEIFDELDDRPPTSTGARIAATAAARTRALANALRFPVGAPRPHDDRRRLLAQAHETASVGIGHRDPIRGLMHASRHLELALATSDEQVLFRALAHEYAYAGLLGPFVAPYLRAVLARAHAVATRIPDYDATSEAYLLGRITMGLMSLGQWDRIRDAAERAVEHYDRHLPALPYVRATVGYGLVVALINHGELREARTQAHAALRSVTRDDQFMHTNLVARALVPLALADGDLEHAYALLEQLPHTPVDGAGIDLQELWSRVARIDVALYDRDIATAERVATPISAAPVRHTLGVSYHAGSEVIFARGRAAAATMGHHATPARARARARATCLLCEALLAGGISDQNRAYRDAIAASRAIAGNRPAATRRALTRCRHHANRAGHHMLRMAADAGLSLLETGNLPHHVRERLLDERVRDPVRLLDVLIPGLVLLHTHHDERSRR